MPSVSVGSSAMPTGNGAVTGDRIEAVYSIVDDARRNYLITLTYSELSTALRALIGPHASWCTFSTWSSRTIGYYIRGDIDPLTDYRISRLPLWLRRIVRKPAAQFNRLTSRFRKRAAPRLLARGNREIFAEIARELARFVAEFDDRTERDDERWRRYRASIMPAPPTEVFPAADVELMRRGFEAYYHARYEPDMRRRGELVLLGNILLADYEQRRVDPIVSSALSLFPSRLLNDDPDDPELLTVRDAKPWALQDKGRFRTWIDDTYGRIVTRWRMAIVLPAGRPLVLHSEYVRVGLGLPKPDVGEGLYGRRMHELANAELVDEWRRHDRANGRYRAARARNWTRLGDRMNCIVNVFRARQDREVLYEVDPLTADELRVVNAAPAPV